MAAQYTQEFNQPESVFNIKNDNKPVYYFNIQKDVVGKAVDTKVTLPQFSTICCIDEYLFDNDILDL